MTDGPQLLAHLLIMGPLQSAERNHGNLSSCRVLPKLAQSGVPIDPRQHDVQEDERWGLLDGQVERSVPVLGGKGSKAIALQGVDDDVADLGVVFSDEDKG
jgi:hypothetical protein